MQAKGIFYLIFFAVYLISTLFIAFMVISQNRNPLKTTSWVMVILFVPILGIVFYYFFGQDTRRLRKITKKQYKLLKGKNFIPVEFEENTNVRWEYFPLVKLLNNNDEAVIHQGSEIQYFSSGKEKFATLIEDILNAKQFIHLQYYIFEDDKVGNEVKNALMQKATEGVEVRILYDDVANWKTKDIFYESMKQSGIEITAYLKVNFPLFTSKVNYRNHRKIVIIDGLIGYIGGMNIADRYCEPTWRDMHLRIKGRGVLGLQSCFLIDWASSGKPTLQDNKYFPKSIEYTNNVLQIAAGGPTDHWHNLLQATLQIFSNAKNYVYIQTPYFLPTEGLLQVMQSTALSGIDVRLMVPETLDVHFVGRAAQSYFADIMNAGVKIYLYQPAFLHSKMFVVDDFISVVGSANMDFRSFEHNFEVNAYIYDESFAKEMKTLFLGDQKNCKQIILKEWRKRPRKDRFKESVLRMFSPLL